MEHPGTTQADYDNNSYLETFFQKLQESNDKSNFSRHVQQFDQELYEYYAAQNYKSNYCSQELYQTPFKEAVKLNIPQQHSLADSMLRSTLGCDEKFAQKYLQITDLTQKKEEDEKRQRIERARNKFASYNTKTDFTANTKPFMNKLRLADQRPVIQNEYDMYVKTQLTFLDKPKPSSNNKDYSSKHTEIIAKKITELGGIEDTIGPIEHSLSTFELKNVKVKGLMGSASKGSSNKVSPSPSRGSLRAGSKDKDSWLDRSKALRNDLSSKAFL